MPRQDGPHFLLGFSDMLLDLLRCHLSGVAWVGSGIAAVADHLWLTLKGSVATRIGVRYNLQYDVGVQK